MTPVTVTTSVRVMERYFPTRRSCPEEGDFECFGVLPRAFYVNEVGADGPTPGKRRSSSRVWDSVWRLREKGVEHFGTRAASAAARSAADTMAVNLVMNKKTVTHTHVCLAFNEDGSRCNTPLALPRLKKADGQLGRFSTSPAVKHLKSKHPSLFP